MASPNKEKYLIKIYHSVSNQGYARVSQLAKSLNVSVSSASKMIGKLNREELIHYQPYGVITLTEIGQFKGAKLTSNHQILVRFFRYIGFEEDKIEEEVTNIESYISSDAIEKIKQVLVEKIG
jgi:DtxR family transcriptional regulator, Mn-dependent transcriptional regulator